MKASLHSGKTIFSYCYAFVALSSFVLLAACEKEAKTNSITTAMAGGTSRAAESISTVASKVDTSGLVAWYNFDSGSLADLSTYHNRVIFSNAQPAADRNGVANNAYQFNGSSSYIEIKNSPSLSPAKEITLFVIVKFDDFYEGKCHANRILQKGYTDGVPGFYTIGTADDYYTHNMNCSQPVDKAHETIESGFCNVGAGDTTEYVQTGHWYHLVYTYGHGVSSFYVNGRLTDSHPDKLFPSANSDNLFIGTTNTANTEYPYWLNGSVDQVAIFNKALNAAQVARLSAY